jgi:hypothetical protein
MPFGRSKKIRKDRNGKYLLLFCADTINIVGKNITDIKKNTGALLEIGPEVKGKKKELHI